MKLCALLALLICCTLFAFGQKNYAIKGSVTDTMATYKLVNTTITLLNQKDSTLVKYARANEEGTFAINNLRPGKFILLVTYPGYADYTEDFVLDSLQPVKDFGSLNLILKATLLEGVIIKGKVAAITIKGDTTEFNAGSYNIQPNSKVEDLLKQLPGIQVDRNGKITAHGQKVNKVLVDGEEFFGDDPTLVTKNLRGDMIDKVQLYDKKSDQSTFTGIDDGEKSKTINLKLKEDKKNGAFGKADAGIGTKGFYQANANANIFKGREKYSAYGSIGNTGTITGGSMSFDFEGMEFTDDGVMMISGMDMDSYGGGGGGAGIPLSRNAGAHYENKWNDKYGINSNYKMNSTRTKGESGSLTINDLPGLGKTTDISNQESDNHSFSHKLDGTLNMKLDSTSTLKVSVNGSQKNNNSTEDYNSPSKRENDSFINKGIRTVTNETDEQSFNSSAFWAKKLRKKGRTISVNVKQSLSNSEGSGYLNSENEYYNEQGQRDSIKTVDQYKTNKTFKSTFNTKVNYTEPISKDLSLMLTYGININNSSSDRKSFNKDLTGNYNDLDNEFSNNFKLDQLTNNGGAIFNYKLGKSILNFGTRIDAVSFKQMDLYQATTIKRDFVNWNPQLRYSYNISRSNTFQVNYSGRTTQPGIEQIQPFRANTNPLNIIIGNPDLKPAFSNSIGFSYSSYKMLAEQNLIINGNFGFTQNTITNSTSRDKAGNTTTQAINLSDKTPINFQLGVSGGRNVMGLNMGLSANAGGNYSYNISNNFLNTSKSFNYSFGPTVSKYNDKYSFSLALTPSYNTSSTTVEQIKTANDSWGASGNFDFSLNLPGKTEIRTEMDYQYTGKSQSFNESLNRLIWNAYITKKFLKDESLNLSLTGKDLLNQNSGFSRSNMGGTINESRYNTIQRYFMLSLSWDFNRMGGASVKK